MGEKILKYYVESVKLKRECNILRKILAFLFIASLVMVACIFLILVSSKDLKNIEIVVWSFFIQIIILIIILIFIIEEVQKSIYLKKYSVFNKDEINQREKNLIKEYLNKKNICTERHIMKLLDYYEKQMKNDKITFIDGGILIAIVIPIWTQFWSALFDLMKKDTIIEIKNYIIILFLGGLLSLMIVNFYSQIKIIWKNIRKYAIYYKSDQIEDLVNILEEILLDVNMEIN